MEIACPITEAPRPAEDPQDPGRLPAGTLKARVMQSDGTYLRRTPEPRFDCQQFLLAEAVRQALPGDGRRGRACLRRAAPETAAFVPADIRPAFSGAEPGVPGFRPAFCKLPVTECVFLWTAGQFRGMIAHDPAQHTCRKERMRRSQSSIKSL